MPVAGSPQPLVRSRSFILVAVAIAALLVGAVGVYAYDKSQNDVIANGVKAGGVDIGGMHGAAARRALDEQLTPSLNRPVAVTFGKRRFELTGAAAHVRVDTNAMVQEALNRSHDGNVVGRALRALTGGKVNADIPVAVSYDRAAVQTLVRRIARRVDRAPQDATIDMSGGSITTVNSHTGRQVDTSALATRVGAKLTRAGADRSVAVPITVTQPKVTTRQLAQRYPTVITINRSAFTLKLWRNLRVVKTYPIAVGMQGLETPAGRYGIQDKEVNPSWHVPNSSWAGSLAGQVIPPGPQDPIKARWMGIANGAGIHGTDETGSIGTAGSHGCIRMLIPDVIDLYDRVSVGTPVFIA